MRKFNWQGPGKIGLHRSICSYGLLLLLLLLPPSRCVTFQICSDHLPRILAIFRTFLSTVSLSVLSPTSIIFVTILIIHVLSPFIFFPCLFISLFLAFRIGSFGHASFSPSPLTYRPSPLCPGSSLPPHLPPHFWPIKVSDFPQSLWPIARRKYERGRRVPEWCNDL